MIFFGVWYEYILSIHYLMMKQGRKLPFKATINYFTYIKTKKKSRLKYRRETMPINVFFFCFCSGYHHSTLYLSLKNYYNSKLLCKFESPTIKFLQNYVQSQL